jgi:lipopolysaccharide export system protein LptC
MKNWSGQVFIVGLLALLAGLTFWLDQNQSVAEARADSKLRHDPDAMADNFVMRRFDETGVVKYRLSAPHMKHYPDDDSSILTNPTLITYRPDAPPVTIVAKNAVSTSKGSTVFMWDDVSITRAASPERQEMVARMPDLTAQTEDGFAFTDSPVHVTQGESWVKATGAFLDNNTSILTLQSQVTGLYIRSRPTP